MRRPIPVREPTTAAFWDAAAEARLVILRCRACGTYFHPPLPVCETCRSLDLAFEDVSGRGRIASRVIVASPVVAGFEDAVPYAILAVELDEQSGLLVVANLVGRPAEEARIGRRVRVTFERVDDGTALPQFELDDEVSAA